MDEAKYYSVTILGTMYTIKSNEQEVDLLKSVDLLNECLSELNAKNIRNDKQTAIVLAALRLANMIIQNQQNQQALLERVELALADHSMCEIS